MDTESADRKSPSPLVAAVQVLSVLYLVPLIALLIAIDVYDVWPGHDRPFNSNVSALIKWSQLALAWSFLGVLLLTPLLLLTMVSPQRRLLSAFLLIATISAWLLTWGLRWYDAFGIGV